VLSALNDNHERTECENLERTLDHLQDQRKLESVIDGHEMELAKQTYLVEALNQELDLQDHELSLERSRFFTHTTAFRQLSAKACRRASSRRLIPKKRTLGTFLEMGIVPS
jgi:hypothetical protein